MKNQIYFLLGIVTLAGLGYTIGYFIVDVPNQIQAFGLGVAILFYPILRYPLIGLYTVIILSPFLPFFRRLYYLIAARPKLDPLIIVGDVIALIMILGLFFEFREQPETDRKVRLFIALVSAYIVFLLSRAFAFTELTPADGLAQFKFFGPPVLFFFIGVFYAGRHRDMHRLWNITVLIGILMVIYALRQLYFGYSHAEKLWFSSINFSTLFISGLARPFSTLQSPAAFADYCLIATIGLLMIIRLSKSPLRFGLYLFVPLLMYGALITSVRSSWVGMLLIFFLWFILSRTRSNKQRIGYLIGAAVVYLIWQFVGELAGGHLTFAGLIAAMSGNASGQDYVSLLITSRTGAITDPLAEHSMLSRVELWRFIFDTSVQNFELALMGRGLGMINADSMYMTYLADFGYPGIIMIVFFVVAFIVQGFKVIDTATNPTVRILAIGITVMNIMFAIINTTGSHIHAFPGDIYYWFWNGVLLKLSASADDPDERKHEKTADHTRLSA